MAIGSIINLGGGGGSLSGKGMIIVDTTAMTVGDVVRVRDVYDSSNVQNKTVATVGTPLFFEVEPYCYYKICMVQDIGGVATEIGGVYRTVDYGQTLFIDVLDKTTLGGIQGILNAGQHNNLMATGDEVKVKINGVDVLFQDAGHDLYQNGEIIFVAKDIFMLSQWGAAQYYYTESSARTAVQDIYAQMDSDDQQYIKSMTREAYNSTNVYATYSDKLWIPSLYETVGTYANIAPTIPQHQFPLFATQANRVKSYQGTGTGWWTTDAQYNSGAYRYRISDVGSYGTESVVGAFLGIVPCFRLTADS